MFAGWLVATRAYHPTGAIAVGATAVLVGASAAAVSANARVLVPRFARPKRWGRYAAAVLATVAGLDLLAVPLIQLLYAWQWHPDPRRFGPGFNLAADGVFILAHLAAASVVAGIARRWRRRPARPDVATAP
ncbi:hypothetical protein tb265_46300 [Gemmatimonadetes bacterium T265]|nr:hypothetical protein tb265_46300 [Gemmatimonadetes bacterium T265]